jgi:hypothetical protein
VEHADPLVDRAPRLDVLLEPDLDRQDIGEGRVLVPRRVDLPERARRRITSDGSFGSIVSTRW